MDKEKIDAMLKEIAYLDENLPAKAQLYHIYEIYNRYTGRDFFRDINTSEKEEEIEGIITKIYHFSSPKVFQHLASIITEITKMTREISETSNS